MNTCTFPRAALRASLTAITKACDKRATIPILACVLIRADAGEVTLTTTNVDVWATAAVAGATAPAGFTAALDFHRLRDAERKAPASDMATVTISGDAAVVGFGGLQMAIPTRNPADFPAPHFKGDAIAEFGMPSAGLRRALEATAFAMSTDHTRYYLNGIYLHPAEGALRFVATDGHRLAHHDVPTCDAGAEWGAILPSKTVALLQPVLKAKGLAPEARLSIGASWMRVTLGGTEILTGLVDGTYPDYGRCIPCDFDHVAHLDRMALAGAVKAILATMDREHAVRMSFEPGAMTLSAGDGDGATAEIQVPAKYDGEAFDIGFNGRYVLDILDAVEGATVILNMNDPGAPMRLEGEGGSFFVLMPMRVRARVKVASVAAATAPAGAHMDIKPAATAVPVPLPPSEAISRDSAARAPAEMAHPSEATSPAWAAAVPAEAGHPGETIPRHISADPGGAISGNGRTHSGTGATLGGSEAHARRLPADRHRAPLHSIADASASRRAVVLGNGRRVGLGNYVEGWKRAKRAPPGAVFRGSPCGWAHVDEDAAEILRQFRAGMHDRINRRLPWFGQGRRWDPNWQAEARRFARQVNTPRLIVRWAPFEFRERFAARLSGA